MARGVVVAHVEAPTAPVASTGDDFPWLAAGGLTALLILLGTGAASGIRSVRRRHQVQPSA